jgi:hypothetical protein
MTAGRAGCSRRLGVIISIRPIRQVHSAGQQSVATQKIAQSFLRFLSLSAATVLFDSPYRNDAIGRPRTGRSDIRNDTNGRELYEGRIAIRN